MTPEPTGSRAGRRGPTNDGPNRPVPTGHEAPSRLPARHDAGATGADGPAGDRAPVLVARDLHRSYGATPALRGVSLTVDHPGEIVAVTGPSGCGKSTLLHCLAGILRPDGGEVLHAGRRIDTLGEAARSTLRRTRFGVLFQFGQLITELSAAENVALPLLLGGARRRTARRAALDRLAELGVERLADSRPGELSGGQQQRVALARALVTEPGVLFADEPTGALDSLAGERMLTVLTGAARRCGTAVVLVTHDVRVAAYADREMALRDGLLDPTGLGMPDHLGTPGHPDPPTRLAAPDTDPPAGTGTPGGPGGPTERPPGGAR